MKATICKLLLIVNLFPLTALSQTDVETDRILTIANEQGKLNVEFYPKAFNIYYSLAEAYTANGEKKFAIANYKKSLELNPGNTNATEMLKKLNGGSQ